MRGGGYNSDSTAAMGDHAPRTRGRGKYNTIAHRQHQFTPGEKVYSKRCGRIGGFDGIIVCARGSGFQVLNPKTGNTYQRDTFDLLPLKGWEGRG